MKSADIATQPIAIGGLLVDPHLEALIRDEVAPGTGVGSDHFWSCLEQIVRDLQLDNRRLLQRRDELQQQLDRWHQQHPGNDFDPAEYESFLREIGFLVDEPEPFEISTENVDPEIAEIAGPQLVVPVDNSRYAINAANARWGSLFDALYGTDAIARDQQAVTSDGYDPVRGGQVIAYANSFLDRHVPLRAAKWSDLVGFRYESEEGRHRWFGVTSDDRAVSLVDADQWVGFRVSGTQLTSLLLRHNGLHIEIQIDSQHFIGRQHQAGIKDVVLEAAVTTIQDCEDSVAAVDAEDKVRVYRNWLGLMKGDLRTVFSKGGREIQRELNEDLEWISPRGDTTGLPGRSLLLVRNVGMHMMTDAVTTADGESIPEGFLDAMVTSLAAIHDLKNPGRFQNSRRGSIYIVKPKQHGPEEVALTCRLFDRVEKALSLPPRTIKLGIMDEERRTTVNLRACIYQAADRVVFINTGFLDRTGDEIHSMMEAGPFVPKPEIKHAAWLAAYEDNNVDAGLLTGFPGKAQIGKGMWAMPDRMAAMMEAKVGHPRAGASTAWVPSPSAAVLHAMHYHEVDVRQRQQEFAGRQRVALGQLLAPCLLGDRQLADEEIQKELENNIQGILGYVVRWIDQGIGCSKVPDIHNVGLMEDRATLRISSQHVANWLHHGVVTQDQVNDVFRHMAAVVDTQNKGDRHYHPMASEPEGSLAFEAAVALVLEGRDEPNGYTEPILTRYRLKKKRMQAAGFDD